MSRRQIAIWITALLVVILGYAWIDGGEQPLRPITQTVDVPASTAP